MIYAYYRLYMKGHTFDRQIAAVEKYAEDNGVEIKKTFQDTWKKMSAEVQPQYKWLENRLKRGDFIIVAELDRLGTNPLVTIQRLRALRVLNVRVVALDIPHMNNWQAVNNIETYQMITDIVVALKTKAAISEVERMREIVTKNIAKANEQMNEKRKAGQPLNVEKRQRILDCINDPAWNGTKKQIADWTGYTQSAVSYYLKEAKVIL